MIKVIILDEFPLFNDLMENALEREGNIKVVKTLTINDNVFTAIQDVEADVVLIDGRMPGSVGLEFVRRLKERDGFEVVVFGVEEEIEHILPYFEAGASGYVTRDASITELVEVIQTANKGHVQISPPIAKAVVERLKTLSETFNGLDKDMFNKVALTRREMEVLELLEKDLSNQEIAKRLHLEVGTVKNHIHSILGKLGVNNRREAVKYLGLLRNYQKDS
jgi:DNA-binding NarL/FixJ family response regulator